MRCGASWISGGLHRTSQHLTQHLIYPLFCPLQNHSTSMLLCVCVVSPGICVFVCVFHGDCVGVCVSVNTPFCGAYLCLVRTCRLGRVESVSAGQSPWPPLPTPPPIHGNGLSPSPSMPFIHFVHSCLSHSLMQVCR